MVDYVREMNVKQSFTANVDRLSICSSCFKERVEQSTIITGSWATEGIIPQCCERAGAGAYVDTYPKKFKKQQRKKGMTGS